MTAPVQVNEFSAAAADTTAGVTQTSDPTLGNTNVVWVRGPSGATVSGVADSQGNTYTARGNVTEAGTGQVLYQFTAPITSSGANTVTATYGASTANRGIYVLEGAGTFDVANTGTDTGNNPTGAVSATNTAQPATVLMLGNDVQGGTPGVGSGFTNVGTGWATLGLNCRVQYKEVASVGSQSGTFANASFDRVNSGLVILLDFVPPAITLQPVDQATTDGGTASFDTTVTGATSYQWERLPPLGGSWANVSGGSGGTTADYTTPTLSRASDAGALYRLKATNSSGDTYSNAVGVRIVQAPTSYSFGGLVVGSSNSFVGESVVGAADAAAGGAYTLTAEQGSFTLSGQAAGLRAARRITAAQGAFTLSGQAAGLRRGFPMVAQQGSYTITGQTAGLRAARKMTAAQGSFALSGQSAALAFVRKLAAAQGAFALTGQAAALRATRTLAAAQGTFTLSGQTVRIAASRLVAAGQGAYSLTGQNVTLTYSGGGPKTIAADQGAYTISGQAVGLRVARRIAAAQGSYSLTGQAAGLRAGRKIAAAQGSFTLTGQAAALRIARAITAQQGSYSLNGQAVGTKAARRISMSSGGFTLTGQVVGLATLHRIALAQGAFALDGQAVSITATRRLAIELGLYELAGQLVTLTFSGTPTPISALRTYPVKAENRTYLVGGESRVYVVRSGVRTYLIPGEARSYAVRRENRTWGII